MEPLRQIPLSEIRAAQQRILGCAIRSPLVRLNVDDAPAEIYLKLENLQPIGSFKLRGAANALALTPPSELSDGVYTCSTGNMAQGLAWVARRMGVPCTIIVPDHAPQGKLDAIARLGARSIRVPFDEWWGVLSTRRFPGLKGKFVHPSADTTVMAGNGTIALEILEDLPDVDAILVPYGAGGLCAGIASAIRAQKPDTRVYACEVDTAAPFSASLAAGSPQEIRYTPSFVEGIGGKTVLPEMWDLVRALLDGSLVSSLSEIGAVIRLMVERNHIVAEGAGGAPVAAALAGKAGRGKVVCVVSGGNLGADRLAAILDGRIP
jgi:threonine dehydratase